MTATEGFVQSQSVKIHYLAKGGLDSKKTTLLFVPGIMMPASIWEPQLEYFSKDYRVVAIDPRSHGESELSSEGNYAYSMAKDIQSVVEALDLGPLVVIGWSLAVAQVVNYAAHLGSNRLIGLALVDGIVGANANWPFYQPMVDQWVQFQMDREGNTKKFIKSIFKQPQPDAYLEKLNDSALGVPTNTVMTLITNYILQDFHALLPRIKVPVWIATVEGPRLDYMREMQKEIRSSQLEVFKDAGHAIFVDQSDSFNHSLGIFIKSLKGN